MFRIKFFLIITIYFATHNQDNEILTFYIEQSRLNCKLNNCTQIKSSEMEILED